MSNANPTSSELRYASDRVEQLADAATTRLEITPLNVSVPADQRGREILRVAQEAFAKTGSWVVFYREMLGVDGAVRKMFKGKDADAVREFENSDEFAELQEMVAALRSQDTSKGDAVEPERMITIRLPMSVHEALKRESEEVGLSINQLSISKLLQPVAGRFIPLQQGARRGRRPGPQGPRNVVKAKAEIDSADRSISSENTVASHHSH